jgi:uncharacterized oxidoreductase
MKLSGNTILITGGSDGIGLELAKELQKRGNTVIITGRNKAKLDKVQKQWPQIHTLVSDAGELAEIQALYKKVTKEYPDLNVLINNAGIMRELNFHDESISIDSLTEEIDINLKGPIRMVKQFLPHLKKKATAAIMNVSSGLAFVPLPTSPVYCATKAGLHSFTLSLRVQLKNTKVLVFELAPPATETQLLSKMTAEDRKGVNVMSVENMVATAISGMEQDKFEIRPGQSNQLKMMSRLAPTFILNQLSKPMDRMLKASRQ